MADLVTSDPLVLLESFGIDIDRFDRLSTVKAPLWDQSDPSIVYSCTALFHHIAGARQLCRSILDELAFFSKHLFLSWMEVALNVSGYPASDLENVHHLILVCVDDLIEITTYVIPVARLKIIMN